jgi:hypothetical protein
MMRDDGGFVSGGLKRPQDSDEYGPASKRVKEEMDDENLG